MCFTSYSVLVNRTNLSTHFHVKSLTELDTWNQKTKYIGSNLSMEHAS